MLWAPAGLELTEQERETAPVKPPLGVTVIVDVEEAPDLIAVSGLPVIAKDGAMVKLAVLIALGWNPEAVAIAFRVVLELMEIGPV